jgi:hypothetical protein
MPPSTGANPMGSEWAAARSLVTFGKSTRETGIRVAPGGRALGGALGIVASAPTTLIGAACGPAGGLHAARSVETMLFEVPAVTP